MSEVIDMRAQSAARTPREFFEDTLDLGRAMEDPEPPLALSQEEADALMGRPVFEDGRLVGVEPAMRGAGNYHRERFVEYRCDDGRLLRYEYEGFLAYALASVTVPDEAQNQQSGGEAS